jgi:hypothetical protein
MKFTTSLSAILFCFCSLLLIGCGWSGDPTRKNDFIPLTSIELTVERPTIAAHTSTTITAKGNYAGFFTRDVTDQVIWSSDTPAVAAFPYPTRTNRVAGLGAGLTTITARIGTVSTTTTVTVSAATLTAVTISPVLPSVANGLSQQFTATGTFSDTTTQDITFDASWAANAPDIASVSDAIETKGLVSSHAMGASTISATLDGHSDATILTVIKAAIQSIAVSPSGAPSALSLTTLSFTAIGTYTDGTTQDITSAVTWSSSSPTVASVSGSSVTTLTQGASFINATLDAVTGSSALQVTGGNLTAISLSPTSLKLVKDSVSRITATGTFSNNTTRDITNFVSWTTSDATLATMTTPGGKLAWVNPLGVTSTATVTAKYGDLSAVANLTVTAPTLSSVALSATSADLTVDTNSRLTLKANYSDGTSQDVTFASDWTSSDTAVVSADNSSINKGRIIGKSAGTTAVKGIFGGFNASATVTVQARQLQSLTIGALSMAPGEQTPLKITATYSDSTTADVTELATLSVDNQNVGVMADKDNLPGQIFAVNSGTATVTASFGGITKTATITVK